MNPINHSKFIPLATQRHIKAGLKKLRYSFLHPNEKLKHISTIVFEAIYSILNQISMNLKQKPRSSGGDLVNFAFKKRLHSNPVIEKQLHKAFDGSNIHVTLKQRKLFAESFLKENLIDSDDPEGILRILSHRKILNDIQSKGKERSPKVLLERIHELTNPGSKRVVHLEGGGSSFSIPGGWLRHSVTYEIKMVPDGKHHPRYFFVIHNRGQGVEHKLHGNIQFRDSEGAVYRKTSLEIEVPLQALSEPFLKKLMQSTRATKNTPAYQCIEQFLLAKGGKIQQSPTEIRWYRLRNHIDHLKNHAFENRDPLLRRLYREMKDCEKKLMHEDPRFHSIQMFGTCTESNATGPEKKMASPKARDQLKLYTIQKMTANVKKRMLMIGSYKKELLQLSEKRQAHLKNSKFNIG